MASQENDQSIDMHNGTAWRLPLIFMGLVLLGVVVVSPYALLSLVLYGLPALLVVGPAILFGVCLIPLFRWRKAIPLRWQILLGASLGIGTLSLAVLLSGLAGILYRPVWIVLLTVMAGVGIIRFRTWMQQNRHDEHDIQNGDRSRGRVRSADRDYKMLRYLWLLAAPFFTLAIVAASDAPGWTRQEEGFGYDVLEYHLQMPKEYYHAGRITYAPHNVYANFPANVEMLYLLAMILMEEDVDTGVTANLIHLTLGVLTVFAAWVIAAEWSWKCGLLSGLVTATTGWLIYLSGLAYVELGMLFFGLTATGALIRGLTLLPSHRVRVQSTDAWKWFMLSGLSIGFSCGCKYIAVAMIAFPLLLAVMLIPLQLRKKMITVGILLASTLITFSPWLIKNMVMTGNPVFPLANTIFQSHPAGWDEQETQRWNQGHESPEDETSIPHKLSALWNRVVWDHHQRMGPILFVLSIGGLFGRKRNRTDTLLLLMAVIQLGVWLFATHLFARFAVVLLIPLILLAGRSWLGRDHLLLQRMVWVMLIAGAVWNVTYAAKLHRQESPHTVPASIIYEGQSLGFEYFHAVNNELEPNAYILLLGDARAFYFQRRVDYCVVFNRNPFVEMVESANNELDVIQWLKDKGYTHVLVHWGEIHRLSKTYGFSSMIEPGLFDRLQSYGLQLVQAYPHPLSGGRYIELYRVP